MCQAGGPFVLSSVQILVEKEKEGGCWKKIFSTPAEVAPKPLTGGQMGSKLQHKQRRCCSKDQRRLLSYHILIFSFLTEKAPAHCAGAFSVCCGPQPSNLPSSLQGPHEGGVVGVLQVTAHRDAVGQTGDLHLERLQQP